MLIAIFGTLRGDVFFSRRNLLNIGLGITILGVLAMSQTVVIVAGGLDIAVGATVGLTTVSTAMAIQATGSPAAGIAAGLVIGGLAGLVNGLIITYGRVNAVIATLGTMAIFRGIAFIMSDGQSIAIFSETFRFIGIGRILGLPLLIWILIATAPSRSRCSSPARSSAATSTRSAAIRWSPASPASTSTATASASTS